MTTFISVINTLSADYVRRVADVPRGCTRRPPRERIRLPSPVEIQADIRNDADDDEPVAVELSSEESCGDENDAVGGLL
ncbi:hypothetical protein ON010_g15701 [Phytophthora cinnamomi]|nr:hypothetical protein ON010_g15701 [Phytophthora cinnamomi]